MSVKYTNNDHIKEYLLLKFSLKTQDVIMCSNKKILENQESEMLS